MHVFEVNVEFLSQFCTKCTHLAGQQGFVLTELKILVILPAESSKTEQEKCV